MCRLLRHALGLVVTTLVAFQLALVLTRKRFAG